MKGVKNIHRHKTNHNIWILLGSWLKQRDSNSVTRKLEKRGYLKIIIVDFPLKDDNDIMVTCVQSHYSCVWLLCQTVTCQAPLSMGFSRQEYWSVLTFCPPDIMVMHFKNECYIEVPSEKFADKAMHCLEFASKESPWSGEFEWSRSVYIPI